MRGDDVNKVGYDQTVDYELALCTANNTGTGVLTITRGQDGTSGRSFLAGSVWTAPATKKMLTDAFARIDQANGNFVGALGTAGLTGAVSASRYVGATASGPPTTGTFAIGDFVVAQDGAFWICTTAGTPGTWRSAASLWKSRAYQSGTPTINGSGPGTDTAMTFNLETYDPANLFSASAFVVPTGGGGYYAITAQSSLAAGVDHLVWIRKNGTTRIANGLRGTNFRSLVTDVVKLAAADYIEALITNFGANTTMAGDTTGADNFITIHFLSST